MSSPSTPTLSNFGSSNWIAYIPGYDELTIKLTKFTIPEVTAGVTPIGNRTEYVLQMGGDHVQFDNLELEFLLDENFLNYIKLFKWMRGNVRENVETTQSIFVHFIGNDKKFQGVEIEFLEAFPISLSQIELDTDGNDTDVHCSVTFAYTAFDFVDQTNRDAVLPLDA